MNEIWHIAHTVIAFIVAISVLVAVHEYGHFAVARALGVKVLRYSIGFGPRLFGWRRGEVDYWISAVPLGGYVKMLDEREGPVPECDQPRAFNRQPPWKRILVVAAGPGINFLFAILAYSLVYVYGVPGLRPVVGGVAPQSIAAAAGLHKGDTVVSFAGEPVRDWQSLRIQMLRAGLNDASVPLQVRSADGAQRQLLLPFAGASPEPAQLLESLGISMPRPQVEPVVGKVMPGSPAAQAGLRKGDTITAINGQAFNDWAALVKWVAAHPGAQVRVQLLRNGQPETVEMTLQSIDEAGQRHGRMGVGVDVDPSLWQDWRSQYLVNVRLAPWPALKAGAAETWDVSVLTVGIFWQMLTGHVSWSNISGPIQIAEFAGTTASIGLAAFLGFLGLVSVSLGVLNLLPVPLLDGGHLVFDILEWVRGKPVSEKIQVMGQQLGILLLAGLMTLAIYNDLVRLFGNH